MASKFYGVIGISGGTDGYLDDIDGASLLDTDGAITIGSDAGLFYLDADSATAQAIPTVMSPDANPGDKRWILSRVLSNGLVLYEATTTNPLTFTGSSGNWVIDNGYDGGTITLQGENSGNSTMVVLDPAGAAELYYAGTKEAETGSGFLDAVNGLKVGTSTVTIDDIVDEDAMTSNSATALVTQQSVKAYVDNLYRDNNFAINGDFDIWQNGTSFAAIADGTYSADMFVYRKNGVMVHTVSKETSVLPTFAQSNHTSKACIKIDCTTVDSSIAATDYCLLEYQVEGYNLKAMAGKTITISFWMRATKTGVYCVAFSNSIKDYSYVSEITISSADTWEKKTVSVTIDNSTGTWDYTTGSGLRVSLCLAGGSTYQTTADTWAAGNYMATSSQVNACDSTDNNVFVSQFKIELGSVATKFVGRRIEEEISLCQRFFEKSYDITTDPATATELGMCTGIELTSTTCTISHGVFQTPKRATPTIVFYDESGTVAKCNDYNSGSFTYTISSISNTNNRYIGEILTLGSSIGAVPVHFHWTADARLS